MYASVNAIELTISAPWIPWIHQKRGRDGVGDRNFADESEAKSRERESYLHAGDDALDLPGKFRHNFRAGIAFGDELAHARHSHGDQRKLHGGEKRVHADQKHHRQQANEDHIAILAVNRCARGTAARCGVAQHTSAQ